MDNNVHNYTCTCISVSVIYNSICVLFQIDLPQSVCGRWAHSLSSVTMKRNTEWLIITGGLGKSYSHISGVNVTVIVEIG